MPLDALKSRIRRCQLDIEHVLCEQTGFEIVGIFAWKGLMIRGCGITTSRSGILMAFGGFNRGCRNILTPYFFNPFSIALSICKACF